MILYGNLIGFDDVNWMGWCFSGKIGSLKIKYMFYICVDGFDDGGEIF